jgi:hypothetical protein
MPYSQYNSLASIRKILGIKDMSARLFPELIPVQPSSWLQESIALATETTTAYFSEKSRSEALVFPILMELKKIFENKFSLYSGAFLDADKERGLNGECDFVLSKGAQSYAITIPFFCVIEAKDNDIKLGIPQCIAQLVGARILNEQEGIELPCLYGAVTTGTEWQFMKLEGQTVIFDTHRYYIANMDELLGALSAVGTLYVEK